MEKNLQPGKTIIPEKDFIKLMTQIQDSNTSQETYARKQYFMSQITAAVSILILSTVLYVSATLLPKANATFQNLNVIMGDLQVITSELASSDLDDMIDNVNRLVISSQESVQDTMSKLNAIDIDALNNAIRNLSDIIAPMAKLVNYFS